MATTDWRKWDKIAASLSDDEEDERVVLQRKITEEAIRNSSMPAPAGVGNALRADGAILPGENRAGNARGNALSTNAPVATERPIDKFSWNDGTSREGFITITVPLGPLGAVTSDQVRTTFSKSRFTLEVKDNTAGASAVTHYLRVSELPEGGIDPEACSHNVETSGGRDVQSRNDVVIALKKQNPQSRWAALGKIERPVKKPLLSLSRHRWIDEEKRVTVWVDAPGVHTIPPERVRVRFRELSFDILIEDLLDGKDYTFAVTELPMEIVVPECSYVIRPDCVQIRLRKWAATGWFKLQVHR